jgi:dihydroxyacid dehydratase/phosphogluconate dehydratase
MHSPELETLDQLLSGDMPFSVIAALYPAPDACKKGLLGLLQEGDVLLLNAERAEISRWQWRELFGHENWMQNLRDFRRRITSQGATKVA